MRWITPTADLSPAQNAPGCRIAAPAFLTQPDATNGGVKPFRTFLGPRYVGGPSDHLPLVADFEWQQ